MYVPGGMFAGNAISNFPSARLVFQRDVHRLDVRRQRHRRQHDVVALKSPRRTILIGTCTLPALHISSTSSLPASTNNGAVSPPLTAIARSRARRERAVTWLKHAAPDHRGVRARAGRFRASPIFALPTI